MGARDELDASGALRAACCATVVVVVAAADVVACATDARSVANARSVACRDIAPVVTPCELGARARGGE
jgi:hypothetical protein